MITGPLGNDTPKVKRAKPVKREVPETDENTLAPSERTEANIKLLRSMETPEGRIGFLRLYREVQEVNTNLLEQCRFKDKRLERFREGRERAEALHHKECREYKRIKKHLENVLVQARGIHYTLTGVENSLQLGLQRADAEDSEAMEYAAMDAREAKSDGE